MSHPVQEPSYFLEVLKLPADVKNAWLKITLKAIKNLINNQTFIMYDPYQVTPCMDVLKANIQYDGSLYKLKLKILSDNTFRIRKLLETPGIQHYQLGL